MSTPRRRWFRFGLRTMFVLVTVFGVWLGVQVNWILQRREALRDLPVVEEWFDPQPHIRAPWSIRVLGEQGVRGIGLSTKGVPLPALIAHFKKLSHLFPECEWFGFVNNNEEFYYVFSSTEIDEDHAPYYLEE